MIASIAYNTSPQNLWVPLCSDSAAVFYEGSILSNIVANDTVTQDGFDLLGAAVGVADNTGRRVPYGLVTGFNVFPGNESYSGGRQIVTSVVGTSAHATTVQYLSGVSEHSSPHDGVPMAQVALITPTTYIKMPIFNGWGTAITEGVVTAAGASTTGAGFTTAANFCDFTPVAGRSSVFCRSGGNRGSLRVTSDTSKTTKVVYQYYKYDVGAGDVFVGVPFRLGHTWAQIDATSTFLDASWQPATNYYCINIVELNLSESGEEYAIFNFGGEHFLSEDGTRA